MDHLTTGKIYNFQFWLLCGGSFLFFASFNMIIPELPAYLTSLGGEDYKGLIIALFTLTAGLSRPFSGKLTDTVGRIPIMIFGSAVCMVAGLLYPLLGTVLGFLLLRLFHGLSTGFKPTATSAYVADIAPGNRRGEAMGILGFFGSVGMASGPVLGSYIAMTLSLNMMFYVSSMLALISVLVLIGMRETLPEKKKFHFRLLRVSKKDILEPRVFPSSAVLMFNVFAFGVILTIVPDLTIYLGLSNKGVFFAIFTVTSLLVRIFAGQLSDRIGRVPVLIMATLTLITALALIAFSQTLIFFYLAAATYGIGIGMGSPTSYAWTIDLSDDAHRGRAMATMFIALEVGIGAGALISSWLYGNNPENFTMVFMISALVTSCSLFYLIFYRLVLNRRMKQEMVK
ncbi:MAG: MFS transporter [Cyclobacteriaceae bacterium]|nr:MFS transporter [Cyclobacteriaceae bacterium]